jgi:thiol-disulfide isomerase/thioredoxin
MTDPEIYLIRNGKRVGPYTSGAVRSFLATSSISANDLAWHEGLEDWVPVAALLQMSTEAKTGRKPLTVVRNKSATGPVPNLVSTRVARISEQNRFITGEHSYRRPSRGSGPLFVVLGLALIVASFFYLKPHWMHASWSKQYGEALATARDTDKLILVYFTRSRTCGWCRRLDSETLSQPAFQEYAAQNLVILKVDLDRPNFSDRDLKDLNKRFNVKTVPTVIVLNAEDEMLARYGYKEGGPAAWIAELNNFKQQ